MITQHKGIITIRTSGTSGTVSPNKLLYLAAEELLLSDTNWQGHEKDKSLYFDYITIEFHGQ